MEEYKAMARDLAEEFQDMPMGLWHAVGLLHVLVETLGRRRFRIQMQKPLLSSFASRWHLWRLLH